MYLIPELNDKQLNRLSEFLANFSLLTAASLILPNIIGVDKSNYSELLSGITITILSFIVSLIILRSTND